VRIGHLDGDLYDPRCSWLRHRQIASGGAILVRPDRFIAWRHHAGAAAPRAVLAAALSQILARPAGAPATSAV
jgi:2,4-dichlorophenol 6-monooxygenase